MEDVTLKPVFTASGASLEPLGRKTVRLQISHTLCVSIEFIVLPVRRVILSVSGLLERGWKVNFNAVEAVLQKGPHVIPLTACGPMFFLEACVLKAQTEGPCRILAPLASGSEEPRPTGVLGVIRRARLEAQQEQEQKAEGHAPESVPVGQPEQEERPGFEEPLEAQMPQAVAHPKEPSPKDASTTN